MTDVCQYKNYMDHIFAHQEDYLGARDMSYNQIVSKHITVLSDKFDFPETEVRTIYDENKDVRESEERSRIALKYAAQHGVNGTPFFYVNGVYIESPPQDAKGWMEILNALSGNQDSLPRI